MDILLDTSCHASTEKIVLALWMGVPVLTITSQRRHGQIAASLLKSAGKDGWIARSAADLVSIAQNLTSDLDALAHTRQSLRSEIKSSALFQGRELAREMETVIEMALEDQGII